MLGLGRAGRALVVCTAVAMLSGCSGTQAPLATPGATSLSAISLSAMGEAASKDLLYISDLGTNGVDYYTYPAGKLVGTLYGFGSVAGVCTNKAGDVFVVDEAGPVQVFAHGGTTPTRKLSNVGTPYGCAADPSTGNLAVTNLSSELSGAIVVYTKATGTPKAYTDSEVDSTFYCGYDDHGNLFIDGWDRSANPILLRLPKGGSAFTTFKLNASDKNPGGVQWDGTDVAVGNRGNGIVYRIDGTTGSVVQTVALKNGTDVNGFWIAGSTLVGPNWQSGGTVPFWKYPAGGSPSKTLSGFTYPVAAAVSVAK